MTNNEFLKSLCQGIPEKLPEFRPRDESVPHAPFRNSKLTSEQKKVRMSFRFTDIRLFFVTFINLVLLKMLGNIPYWPLTLLFYDVTIATIYIY